MELNIYINDEKVSIDKPVKEESIIEIDPEWEDRPLWVLQKQLRTDLDCSLEYIPVEFSVRTTNLLSKANILTYRDLTSFTESQLYKIKKFGRKSVTEVQERLNLVRLELKAE